MKEKKNTTRNICAHLHCLTLHKLHCLKHICRLLTSLEELKKIQSQFQERFSVLIVAKIFGMCARLLCTHTEDAPQPIRARFISQIFDNVD